jgi:adenylyltransferase/sulfurtransferase
MLNKNPYARYARQTVLPQIGEAGQRRLAAARVAVVGLGALGSASAPLLARAGVGLARGGDEKNSAVERGDGERDGGGAVKRDSGSERDGSGERNSDGFLRLIDRDYVSLDNLQRSGLYTEADAFASTPKALAAAEHLRAINSELICDPRVTHISGENIESLLADVDLVLDGSDNFELRHLLNEACDKLNIPWVYGGVLGTSGMAAPIVPGQTPCFRCFSPKVPPPGSYPSCASAGVLGSVSTLVASLQVTEALKLLLGASDECAPGLIDLDLWRVEAAVVPFERNLDCPTCAHHAYELLGKASTTSAVALCGRDEYQVLPAHAAHAAHGVLDSAQPAPGSTQDALDSAQPAPGPTQPALNLAQPALDLAHLAQRLRSQGDVLVSPHILTFDDGVLRFKLFVDGRMMLKGVPDEAAALRVYSEYVGL